MEDSYWYYHFKMYHNRNDDNAMVTFAGSGVAIITGKSFLPGSVARALEIELKVKHNIPTETSAQVVIEGFQEVDADTALDFRHQDCDERLSLKFSYTAFAPTKVPISVIKE